MLDAFRYLLYTLPIMLALCLMLLGTYYAQNYAGIIGRSLPPIYIRKQHLQYQYFYKIAIAYENCHQINNEWLHHNLHNDCLYEVAIIDINYSYIFDSHLQTVKLLVLLMSYV